LSRTIDDLEIWLSRVSGSGWSWYLKYLSANDTYAKRNVHQGGPYLSMELLRIVFPVLTRRATDERNPEVRLSVEISSHRLAHDIRIVWYNSRQLERRPNGRNEARMTQWGGRDHPLLNDNATGGLVLFAFEQPGSSSDATGCEVWIAGSPEEEDFITSIAGPVEPGQGILFVPARRLGEAERSQPDSRCSLDPADLREEWRIDLPSGEDVLEMALHRLPEARNLRIDVRLMKRRVCEYELFRSIEDHVVLPRVREGFDNVEQFVAFAHSVTNRRKARAGRSLELHARAIFNEERVPYSWTPQTEAKRTPDFVFPSIEHYRNANWPASNLRMLAAKTTCKDRWRQILNEAERIPTKHLLTLQEGVSEEQFAEMKDESVQLVVPSVLHKSYPESIQCELITFERFVVDAKSLVS
jgi:hypothetical protein